MQAYPAGTEASGGSSITPRHSPLRSRRWFGARSPVLGVTVLAGALLASALGVPFFTSLAPAADDASAAPSATPTFENHPNPHGRAAPEPTIGVNPRTGNALMQMGTFVGVVSFDDAVEPTKASWTIKRPFFNDGITLDPYLWTDRVTGRTFSMHLHGACSQGAFTDDDGALWLPMGNACAGVDHPSLATGPWRPGSPLELNGAFPRAVYYCAQDLLHAQCALSVDGGLSFNPAVVVAPLGNCGGLHGHPEVAPDGVVYLPVRRCAGGSGFAFSKDHGTTWDAVTVPGAGVGPWDPTMASSGDRVYFAWADDAWRPHVAVTRDSGASWDAHVDLGALGVRHAAFPALIAGDAERAAVAFLGANGNGNPGAANYDGVWHLYVAFTFNGGSTWTLVDATPNDPVQRGGICAGGTLGCEAGHRNLLDFFDATVDTEGRVLVSYADGCVSDECRGRDGTGEDSRSRHGVIARQDEGRRLYRAFDPAGLDPVPPSAPRDLRAIPGNGTVELAWDEPLWTGDGPVAAYRVERDGTLLADVPSSVLAFTDDTASPGVEHAYAVSVVNAAGAEGDAATVTARAFAGIVETVIAAWSWDGPSGTDGACDRGDDGGVGARWYNPLQFSPTANSMQNGRWELSSRHAADGDCAWYHGVDAAGAYAPRSDVPLAVYGIPLTGEDAAFLTVHVAGATPDVDACTRDGLIVEARAATESFWRATACVTGARGTLPTGGAARFEPLTVDLTPWTGQDDVRIRLRFVSDDVAPDMCGTNACHGYRVDAVTVTGVRGTT